MISIRPSSDQARVLGHAAQPFNEFQPSLLKVLCSQGFMPEHSTVHLHSLESNGADQLHLDLVRPSTLLNLLCIPLDFTSGGSFHPVTCTMRSRWSWAQ
mmetsp:Transcript_49181/g.82479  ORF Transcript_49181/g.82479 Transcript_49181/m.82479 type:complete len:99 (+) Transcript_49181:125-421(+)